MADETQTTTPTPTVASDAVEPPIPATDASPAINYDEIETELKTLRQEYRQLRTQTNQTINSGVGRSDQHQADALRQKIGIATP